MRDQLKIPSDLEDADEDDDYGDEDLDGNQVDEDEEFQQFGDNDQEDQVFALAKENNEMQDPHSLNTKVKDFSNPEMLDRIAKLEDGMLGKDTKKAWQMTGEATASSRPVGSLLETVLDFNTATKLPPTITQERSNNIEAMIKQRVLDELFDDPVRRYLRGHKPNEDDNAFDFTKSKKGLGELYEDDYRAKLLKHDPSAYLHADLTGADASLKKEIGGLMKTLFYQLDQLSNMHFTPRPAEAEAGISTQNVPSLMIEEALPIAVNMRGQSKSARETFSINNQKLREKSELSKEERHKERATRKRKIKAHLKHKELTKKEKRRDQGVAMHDRFEQRHLTKKSLEKAKK